MNTITNREWIKWYQTVGRKPIAHLSKEQRKRIVRGCQGKVVYSSHEEAKPVVDSLPLIDGMFPLLSLPTLPRNPYRQQRNTKG